MKYSVDTFLAESKGALDFIAEKASGAVNVSKTYIEKAQIQLKIREKYTQLGKLCYDMHRNDTDETGNMKKIIAEINALQEDLVFADDTLGKPKVCAFCGAKNSSDNAFCSNCGKKL